MPDKLSEIATQIFGKRVAMRERALEASREIVPHDLLQTILAFKDNGGNTQFDIRFDPSEQTYTLEERGGISISYRPGPEGEVETTIGGVNVQGKRRHTILQKHFPACMIEVFMAALPFDQLARFTQAIKHYEDGLQASSPSHPTAPDGPRRI